MVGEPCDVEAVDDVTKRHRDADEGGRRYERLPARKRVGDGKDGIRRPKHEKRPLGAQPVDDGRTNEQAGRNERSVQHADTRRTETLLRVDRTLQRLETAVADADEEIDAAEVDQGEVDVASTRHAGRQLIVAR